MNKIVFYGCGNISQSIIQGLISSGVSVKDISFIDRNPINKNKLKEMGINAQNKKNPVHSEALVILAVKPKDANNALKEISDITLSPKLISVVAGIKIENLNKYFNEAQIVRAMPITASAFKKGITAVYGEDNNKELVKETKKIFDQVGKSIILKNEDEMNVFTGLIGSGSAYFFYLLEVYEQHLLRLCNNNKKDVNDIMVNFLDGISSSINNATSLNEAIKLIASKGGTTEAGINSLKGNNVLQLFEKGIISAVNRSKELGDEY